MKNIASALAAVLFASATLPGAAFADTGDYYRGASSMSASSPRVAPSVALDRRSTGSIRYQVRKPTSRDNREFSPDHGDYYEGATRPI